jgi:hypothetical protein
MKTTHEAISFAHSNLVEDKKHIVKLVERNPIGFIPFIDYMEEKMVKGPPEGQQFVLTGRPSAGKTTELKRISREFKKRVADRKNSIIHLFSLQNASESQSSLDSAADLWQWIIRSHNSRIWAEQRYTLDEFIEVNNRLNLQPILLIDTVDLLIYGANEEKRVKITEYWQAIISTITKKTNWTVLWSCRTYEWEEFCEFEDLELERIKLPDLDHLDVAKRFNHNLNDIKSKNSENAFLTVLGCVFPIVAGHRMNLSQWSPIIRERYKAMHEDARKIELSADDMRNNAGPIAWIIENLRKRNEHDEFLGTDPLYEGLTDKICEEIAQATKEEKSHLKRLWEEQIEEEFWEVAYAPDTNHSRIHITHRSIIMEDADDDKLLHYLIDAAINNGLLRTNRRSKTYEMAHQLYTEYCIWKVSVRLGREKDLWIGNFPSCKIRALATLADEGSENEALIKEARMWFLPFYVFNNNLARKFHHKDMEHLSQTWKDCIREAAQTLNVHSEVPINVEDNVDHIRYLNAEKRKILENINNTTPLLVNGPPGVGKSHLSYVWIDKKAGGDTWTELQPNLNRSMNYDALIRIQKPKAHFMTLSRGLVKQIDSKIDNYYDKCSRPAEFTSWSIPDYVYKMRMMLEIGTSDELTFDRFKKEFEDAKKTAKGGWRKVSAEELWGEFQNNYIDRFGKRISADDYQIRAAKSKFFGFTKDPRKEAELFARWAMDVGGNKKSLSEQAGECIKKVLDFIFKGSLEDRETIRSMQSEILVLDEIQDLPSPVIFLLLLMHNGPTGSVMMCGDDEQTLELSEFKWNETFSKIAAAFWEYDDHYNDSDSYEKNGGILKKWIDHNLLNEMIEKDMEHLIKVERSVPSIVECVSEAWNNGVSNKIPGIKREHGEIRGTGCIEPGTISEYRHMNNTKNNIPDGVEIHNNWTWDLLIEEAQRVYDDGEDVAFLFPDENLWNKFSDILAEKDIFMDLWTPRLIKGLEYPEVIAICPWEISEGSVKDIILGDTIWKDWDDIETYVVENINTDEGNAKRKIDCIAKLAKQKKRHVNVMLSRSQDLLKIVNIPNQQTFFRTHIPVALPDLVGVKEFAKPEPKKVSESISEHLQNLPEGFRVADAKRGHEDLIASRKTTQALIKRLQKIILSADTDADRLQIQLKANHLAHYLEKISTSATKNIEFPFKLLSIVLENVKANKDSKHIGLFDGGWAYYQKNTNKLVLSKLNKFENYMKEFATKCQKTDDNKLLIPVLELQEFNKSINQHIEDFTSIDSNCFVHDDDTEKITLEGQKLREEIQNEIIQSVFGKKRLIELGVKQWIETAKEIDLKNYLTPINYTSGDGKIFKMIIDLINEEELVDNQIKTEVVQSKLVNDYWAKGKQHLLKQKIFELDIDEITTNIGTKLPLQSNEVSKELIDFFWACIQEFCTKDLRDKDRIQKITKYCFHLHSRIQEEERSRYNLNIVLSDDVKTSIATRLLAWAETGNDDTISKVILYNSLGLFDLLKNNYPVNAHSNPKYNDYKDALKLGHKLATFVEEKEANMAMDQHEVFTFLNDKILGVFDNEHTITETFVESCYGGNWINWDGISVIEQIFDGAFGKYILSKSTETSRENILILLFALLHKEIQSIREVSGDNSDELISKYIKKIFTISKGSAEDNKWQTMLLNERICREIILIPYPDNISNRAGRLQSLRGNWIWDREVGQYKTEIAWNESLIYVLGEQKLDNKLKIVSDEWVEKTSSLFESKKLIRSEQTAILMAEIKSNILDANWRDMVISKGKGILSANSNFGAFVPGINTHDAIFLYHEFEEMRVQIEQEMSMYVSILKGVKRAGMSQEYKDHFGIKPKKQIKMAKVDNLEFENYRLGNLLIDFAAFFNRVDDKGKAVIEKEQNWKKLLHTFKENAFNSVGVQEYLDGNNLTKQFQKILIMFLQNYGSDTDKLLSTQLFKDGVNKYRVKKNSNYNPNTAKMHKTIIERLP